MKKIKSSNSIIKSFKKWYAMAEMPWKYFFITLITACIPSVFYILEPIAEAKVITQLTKSNFTQAMLWVAIAFLFIFLRTFSWHVNYWNWSRLFGTSYQKINNKIYYKILRAQNQNFKKTSIEKITNTINSDIYTVSHFSDILCTKTANLFRVLVTIVIVFINSWVAGLIVIGISVMNYFLLERSNIKIGKITAKTKMAKDEMLEKISIISKGREFLNDYNLSDNAKEHYDNAVKKYIKTKHDSTMQTSVIDNWIYILWKLIVALTTIFLIWTIEGGTLSLTIYLIIVSYLSSSVDKVNNFYMLFNELELANVSAERIQTILNFTESELVEYGSNMENDIDGSLQFLDVSLHKNKADKFDAKPLEKVSFSLKKGDIALIHGLRGCGKRSVFYLLRRVLTPDSGSIVLGGINLYDYSTEVYNHNISYTTHKPFFFDGTIYENLKMVGASKKKTINICKRVGVDEFIQKLPHKYETDINKNIEKFSEKDKYLLGLARALATGSEVVLIYEFPSQLSTREEEEICRLFSSFKNEKTIVVFASNEKYSNYFNKKFWMSDGKIKIPNKFL